MTGSGGDLATIRRVLHEMDGSRRWIVLLGLLDQLTTPLALLAPVPLAIAVDSALGSEPLPGPVAAVIPGAPEPSVLTILVAAAVLQVTVVLLVELRSLAAGYVGHWVGERVTLDVRRRMLANAHQLSFRFHDRVGTADSIYRIQYDAPAVSALGLHGLIPLLTAVVMLGSMVFVILRIDTLLAVIAVVVAPLLVVTTRSYRAKVKPQYKQVKRLESRSLRVVQEVFSAFRVVKAFGMEKHEEVRFEDHSRTALRARLEVLWSEGLYSVLLNVITASGAALILVVGGLRVSSGAITLGALLLTLSYLNQLFGPLQTLSKQPVKLQSQLVSAERVISLLDERPEVEDPPEGHRVDRVRGEFALRGLGFAYDEGQPILQGVDLHVPAGTRVGIVGRTGAGKSTLAGLLIRFYDPTEGAVLLDGLDLREHRLDDLRRQFTMVLQDPFLFSTSIRENISFGRPGASDEDVEGAARAAGVHDFIAGLPDGYDTLVGERGMRLSGGERQRISLARAFLKDAPVLLLDEPTSSVDVVTEATIVAAMDRLMAGRTAFMIAHRLSTLDSCDLVVEVVDGGIRIVREGVAPAASLPAGTVPGVGPTVAASSIEDRAAAAVRRLFPEVTVTSVEAYTVRHRRRSTFRVTTASGAVFAAKLQRRVGAELEDRIYREVLPAVGSGGVRCHGIVPADDPQRVWLVMDHLTGTRPDPTDPEHVAALSVWLGRLHVRSQRLATLHSLPERGPAHGRERLEVASEVLTAGLTNPALPPSTAPALASLRARFDRLLDHPSVLAELFEMAPTTLVHGDISPTNVLIVERAGALAPVVLDWETAGRGSILLDLPSLDLSTYHETVAPWWRSVRVDDLRRCQVLGTALWIAYVLAGDRVNLVSPRPDRAARKVPAYLGLLPGGDARASSVVGVAP